MKKTFRKAIAVILAVLMVAFSVPFSAFAANFGEGTQITANRKWWVGDGVDPSTIKETPTYTGLELAKGDTVCVDETTADLRNEYKPVIAVTVSKVGTNAEAAEAVSGGTLAAFGKKYYNQYYAAKASQTYDAVKAAGNIVNPAQLKAGDRIVVTVEFGGFDILCNGQFRGNFDTDVITPAYYAKDPTKATTDTWKKTDSSTINVNTGEYANVLTFGGKIINGKTGVFTGVITGANFANGTTEESNFFNNDDNTTFGKYGVPSFAYGFEVLKDCDLKDVFHFDRRIAGTEFEPYSRETIANYENPDLYLITGDDTAHTFANWTEIWSEYEKSVAPSTYTIKFVRADGVDVPSQTVNAGEMPKVPTENTASTPVTPLENNQHSHTEYSWPEVSAATKDFTYDEQANVIKENCTDGEVVVTPAELDKAGSKETHCAVCKQVIKTEVIPALQGVNITVAATTLGSTTLNDADATNGLVKRVVLGSDVVLTAKSKNETGEFVGWKVGNKIVSDEATYKTLATADITYEAVFAEKVDTSFTVVFVDPYGNVIDTQTVDSAAKIEVPTAPALPGYTFTGWSMNQEAISKLTDGATIYAQYKKDNVAKYTVTAPEGATLTVDGVETASPATVAYDAKVSVHKDGAQAWKLADGTTVGYGDTYTFFCGSNIELTAEMTAVEKKTTIVIVDAKQMKDSHKVIFNATRTVIPGETVVQQGFVYGKNLADSELKLENVGNKGAAANAGNVKVIYNKNSAEQIALSYGLTSRNGKISAVAFVITKNKQTGKLTPVYSNVMPFTYGA